MLAPSVHPLLWLFGCVLFRGTTTSTDSSVHAVTGQPQSTPHSPEVKNHTSEPSVKSTSPTDLNLTSVGQTTTAKSPSVTTTLLALTVQGQEPKRSESTTTSATQGASSFPSQRGTSQPVTPTPKSSGFLPVPTPTDDKSPLTVAAFDKQKPGTSMVSESCSAGTSQKDNSITLISMKNINMNNSMSYPPSEKVL
ncbi:endothelial cell-specific chemotaxis regulator isoform X5 [Calonectris borealis]|uniref:endothelial cell-specific chemotaxis regulator isoform X5 n=1 Tax=Calonectris borealis TaxID=1323832 RepID=UPI003F4C21B7